MRALHIEKTGGPEVLQLVETSYEDGSPAIEVRDAFGGPYAKLSVNTGRPLAPRHVAIKNWSENEGLAEAALATGLFEGFLALHDRNTGLIAKLLDLVGRNSGHRIEIIS